MQLQWLILGLGNLLLGDEGVGVHAARALIPLEFDHAVTIVEVGTAFLDVLPELAVADRILIIDAMHGGDPPGSIYRIPLAQCHSKMQLASLHGLDLQRVLYMAGNQKQPEAIVLGIEPLCIEWSMELSTPVRNALPALVQTVCHEVKSASMTSHGYA